MLLDRLCTEQALPPSQAAPVVPCEETDVLCCDPPACSQATFEPASRTPAAAARAAPADHLSTASRTPGGSTERPWERTKRAREDEPEMRPAAAPVLRLQLFLLEDDEEKGGEVGAGSPPAAVLPPSEAVRPSHQGAISHPLLLL